MQVVLDMPVVVQRQAGMAQTLQKTVYASVCGVEEFDVFLRAKVDYGS